MRIELLHPLAQYLETFPAKLVPLQDWRRVVVHASESLLCGGSILEEYTFRGRVHQAALVRLGIWYNAVVPKSDRLPTATAKAMSCYLEHSSV